MEELKTVRLLGAAGQKFGRVFKIAASSPAEALRALEALRPGFYAWVLEQHERGVAWRVVTDQAEGLDKDELERGTSARTIIFAPVLQGAGGVGKILLGVALIAVAIFVPAPFGLSSIMLGVGLIGGALVLGGIADLVTPTPQLSGINAKNSVSGTEAARSADLESNLFSRNQGTGGQGECVPVLYGQRRVRSPRIISFDLRNLPETRSVTTSGTNGLLGYVNGVVLS
jgi:predicted phage tail protein